MRDLPWKWKSLSHVWLFADPTGYIVHGILQARILEWVAVPFPRVSSQTRDRTQVSCIAGRFFTIWATRKSAISKHIFPPSWAPLPPHPTHLGHHRVPSWIPCAIWLLPTSYILHMVMYVCQWYSLNLSHLLPPLCPQVWETWRLLNYNFTYSINIYWAHPTCKGLFQMLIWVVNKIIVALDRIECLLYGKETDNKQLNNTSREI